MVDVAKYFTKFLEEESCGKCTPCREGVRRMKEVLTDITEGRGTEGSIPLLEELGEALSLGFPVRPREHVGEPGAFDPALLPQRV